jgi:hypothetical protein
MWKLTEILRVPVAVATLMWYALMWCTVAAGQTGPLINDGNAHGDPPFRLENGWIPLLNGKDLSGWRGEAPANDWFATRGVFWDGVMAPTRLIAVLQPGDTIVNGLKGKTNHLLTDQRFGDVELYAEFLIPQKGNSGIYLQSLYEVQIFDSHGVERPLYWEDCGAIPTRGNKEKGFRGSPPMKNASRPAGEWQSFQIWFQAPRFSAKGEKLENAKFLRVLQNGVLIQENVEVDGPTLGHVEIPEAPANPLLLQGDHGQVAYRNIYLRPLRPILNRKASPEHQSNR